MRTATRRRVRWLAGTVVALTLGAGGVLNACDPQTWTCEQVATGLPMLTSAAVDRAGTVYVVANALIPGAVDVSPLP